MQKVFISQGMNGKSAAQILTKRKLLERIVRNTIEDRVKFIDSYIAGNPPKGANVGLWFLAKSLELMAGADVVIFDKDWEEYRGCKIEYEVAMAYGMKIIVLSYKDF